MKEVVEEVEGEEEDEAVEEEEAQEEAETKGEGEEEEEEEEEEEVKEEDEEDADAEDGGEAEEEDEAEEETMGKVAEGEDDDDEEGKEDEGTEEKDEEEGGVDGFVPELRKRGGGGPAGSSRFQGVSSTQTHGSWTAKCDGKHLGSHATEMGAARAYSKYVQDGIVPVKNASSRFTGLSWRPSTNRWTARCRGKYLSSHLAEEDAARAYNVEAARLGLALNVIAPAGTAGTEPKHAAPATPVTQRNSSHFKGVCWHKNSNRWRAVCKGKSFGYHATEDDAAQAYNIEAARAGLTLNVIQPAGAAGAGTGRKRAAPATAASQKTKKVRLADTSSVGRCRLTQG